MEWPGGSFPCVPVNLPGRDLNSANICAVSRVNLPDFAKSLDFGLVLWSGRAEGLLRP